LILIPFSITSFANDSELAVAKIREGRLSAGKSQSFVISLKTGDFAQIKFDPSGKEVVVIAYDPSGSKYRGTTLGPDEGKFNFVADRSGTYRVTVAALDKTIEGAYTMTLEKVVTLSARLSAVKPVQESPRIKILRASVEAGKQESVGAFWEEVAKGGAPMIEPLADDNKNVLVTFLWRGSPETHNVFVLRLPYAAATPDDYFNEPFGGDRCLVQNRRGRQENEIRLHASSQCSKALQNVEGL